MLLLQGTGLSRQLHRGLSPDHHCVWSTTFLRRTCAGFLFLLLLLLKLNSPEQIADVDEY